MTTVTMTKTLEPSGTVVTATYTIKENETPAEFAKRVRDEWKALCEALEG